MKKIYEIQISVFLKFYCDTMMPICSHIVYGSFDADSRLEEYWRRLARKI